MGCILYECTCKVAQHAKNKKTCLKRQSGKKITRRDGEKSKCHINLSSKKRENVQRKWGMGVEEWKWGVRSGEWKWGVRSGK